MFPHHDVIEGHFTRFGGWGNYPQREGTRPTLLPGRLRCIPVHLDGEPQPHRMQEFV